MGGFESFKIARVASEASPPPPSPPPPEKKQQQRAPKEAKKVQGFTNV